VPIVRAGGALADFSENFSAEFDDESPSSNIQAPEKFQASSRERQEDAGFNFQISGSGGPNVSLK